MEQTVQILKAAGEPTRMRILSALRDGELTVSELVQILRQSQPRVSRHLKLLADSGLIERMREGSWVFYRIAPQGDVPDFVEWLAGRVSEGEVLARDRQQLAAVRAERQAAADAYFKANAGEWDEIRALQGNDEAVEAALVAAFVGQKDAILLDIGTGTGRMLELFSNKIGRGVGIDSNMEMLKIARARLSAAGAAHCVVQLGDMYALEEASASVDAVIIHQVLHFTDTPRRVLEEVARVLRPGGQVLIADYAPHNHEFLREDHAHRRLGFSDQDMQRWCRKAGLKSEQVSRHAGQGLEIDIWDARKA